MEKEENQNNTSTEQNQDSINEADKLEENLVQENRKKTEQETEIEKKLKKK